MGPALVPESGCFLSSRSNRYAAAACMGMYASGPTKGSCISSACANQPTSPVCCFGQLHCMDMCTCQDNPISLQQCRQHLWSNKERYGKVIGCQPLPPFPRRDSAHHPLFQQLFS